VVLARCLAACSGFESGFSQYEQVRKPRTSRVQAISSANTWGRNAEPDTDWLYGYDAWSVPLSAKPPVTHGLGGEPFGKMAADG